MEDITSKETRPAPVKMIWMFVAIALTLTAFFTFLGISGPARFGRMFQNVIWTLVPILLLAGGAGICLSRGTLNLALPGIAMLCSAVYALIAANGGGPLGALLTAVGLGAFLGVVNGLFTIQSGRKVILVTGIASLVLGSLFMAIASQALGGYVISVEGDKGLYQAMGIIFIVLAVPACVLSGLGRNASTNEGEDPDRLAGGGRFVWTFVAGILAGLAGAYIVMRNRAATPATFSGYNESMILPALLAAGALIPNARKSRAEGVFGGVALVFGCLFIGIISVLFSYQGLDVYVQREILAFLCILLLIPNILIWRRPA